MSVNLTDLNGTHDLITSTACPGPHQPVEGDLFAFVVDTIIVGCLCVVGIVGNAISIVAFSTEKHCTTSLLLTALAVSDLLYLAVHGLLFQCFRSVYPYTGSFKKYFDNIAYIDVWEYPFGVIFQTLSVFFVVLVAIDRYIAVCWPFRARNWSTVRRVKIQIVFAILLGVGVNFPRFFTSKTVQEYDVCTDTVVTKIVRDRLGHDQVYGYVMTCVYIILIYLLPIAILVVINTRLAFAVRKRIETQHRLSCSGQQSSFETSSHKITTMLCLVILVFLICQIPISANHLQYATGGTMSPLPQRYFNVISNMLVIFNSAVNFFIYVLMGNRFRKRVKGLFTACFSAKKSSPSKVNIGSFSDSTCDSVIAHSQDLNLTYVGSLYEKY